MPSRPARVLVLCKTYPSPSAKHVETSCVAGIDEAGALIRLFPIPFRYLDGTRQFKKWQWISVRVELAKNDYRPESHKVFFDTIEASSKVLPTTDGWRDRRAALSRAKIFDGFDEIESNRRTHGATLALLKPSNIIALDITPTERPNWTPDELAKLRQSGRQGNLLDAADESVLSTLKKLPFDFHYRYQCKVGDTLIEYRHKIADWEAGALFWNMKRIHKAGWEAPFRAKLEQDLPSKDLMFLMGTIHRFPDQWMIVSLIYPPKQPVATGLQESLFGW